MKENEKNNANESVLKQALLEYEEVVKAAKNKLAENNSKELDSLIAKFLKESENRNEPFDKATKEPAMATVGESTMIQKPIGETIKEEGSPAPINMKEASLSEVEAAFDGAQPDDDFQIVRSDDQQQMPSDKGGNGFDITSIEGEIDEMMREVNNAEQMQQAQQQPQQSMAASTQPSTVAATSNPNDPMAKMKEMYEGMGKFLKEMEDMGTNQAMMNEFHSKMSEMYGESYKAQMDEAKIGELFSMYKKVKGGNAGEPMNKVSETSVAEVAAPAATPAMDEVHGVSLSSNKLTGAEVQPRIESGKEYAANKIRLALQKESIEKKMAGILKENLSLTKQLNKTKTELTETKGHVVKIDSLKKLNEDYKTALEKYRIQLKEMAVLNTNISYVNSLFINEGLALSLKDKEEIIKQFKSAGTILESETTYKKLLNDFSESKKTIKESLEEKVNSTIVENSSAKKLEESVGSGYDNIEKILRYSGISTEKKQIV